MRFLVSTVCRHSVAPAPSGCLWTVDWRDRTSRRTLIPEPEFLWFDPNSRGGLRGVRGLAFGEHEVAVCNFETIFRFDQRWRSLGTISHPHCASLHDIVYRDDSLWATSARNDLVFEFALDGGARQVLDLRKSSAANTQLGWQPRLWLSPEAIADGAIDFRDPRTHQLESFDGGHVNSVCFLPNGDLLVSLGLLWNARFANKFFAKRWLEKAGLLRAIVAVNRGLRSVLGLKRSAHTALLLPVAHSQSAVVRIATNGERTLCWTIPGATAPSHSLVPRSDGTVCFMNSTSGSVMHFDPSDGRLISSTQVTERFLRGGTWLDDQRLVVGDSQDLILFDVATRTVLDRLTITDNPDEHVYDIKPLPAHFSEPPAHLETVVAVRRRQAA